MDNLREFNCIKVTTSKNGKKSYWWAAILLDIDGKFVEENGYNRYDQISKKLYDEFHQSGRFKVDESFDFRFDDADLGNLPNSKLNKIQPLPIHPRLKTPISYYGGKQRILKYILPLIPDHRMYCEPFFGGGAVFFSKKPSESEVINDINGEAVNFYRVVQTDFNALEKEIKATLHSRQLYYDALKIYRNSKEHSDLKRAWAFWTLTNQGFSRQIGSWGYDNTNIITKAQVNKRENFTRIYAERLKTAQVECKDAIKVILRCDSKTTFHYCDPPYFNSDMGHYKGYTEEDFETLLKTLHKLKGKFLLSCYPPTILNKYIKRYKWHSKSIKKSIAVTPLTNKQKTEMLVYNFKLKANQ